mgnify:CR=1 FL=1
MKIRKLLPAVIGSIALLTSVAPQAAAAEGDAGVYRMEVSSPAHGRPLDVTIWYPAAATGGEAIKLGDSPLFLGATARLDAPIADGRFPLVLLSHGAGLAGRAEALSWLAVVLSIGSIGSALSQVDRRGAFAALARAYQPAMRAYLRARLGADEAEDALQAFLAQIARHNRTLNAIVATLPEEHCLELAEQADRASRRPPRRRPRSAADA